MIGNIQLIAGLPVFPPQSRINAVVDEAEEKGLWWRRWPHKDERSAQRWLLSHGNQT